MNITLENVKHKLGGWQGDIVVSGKFLCIEYGNTEEELQETFSTSKDIYEMLATEAEVE
ncbi:hypothetical protein IACHDJAJ_00033 [Aeromonas phage vB_AdhS_TS3]|nr:hypothetical protein IACHDJAJ_00033 [Aeromonas phage vB_AdhS_TS3]